MFKASSESISGPQSGSPEKFFRRHLLFMAMTRMTLWATVPSLMRAHHNAAWAYFDSEFAILEFMICGRRATSLRPESFGFLRCDDASSVVQCIRVN